MYDLIIIGQGPAGITAAIYSSIYKLNTLIVGEKPGGYIAEAYKIINFPTYPEISGIKLAEKFKKHLKISKIKSINDSILQIKKIKKGFKVYTHQKKYESKSIIIATGSVRRKLSIPGETEFMGKGVAYCATCDAFFFRDKITAVIGGSDSALTSALQLAEVAKKVYLIFRKDNPTALPQWIEKASKNKKIVFIPKTNVTRIIGKNHVSSIEIDKKYKGKNNLAVNGIFIEIGTRPLTDIIKNLGVEIDNKGFIKVASNQMTNINGIFAAGDVTTGSNGFEQIITACSEGAIAANSVFKYLKK